MMNRYKDNISHTDTSFDFNGPDGVYYISNSSYLPYFELRNMNNQNFVNKQQIDFEHFSKIYDQNGDIDYQ